MRYRCVSKLWSSFITLPSFINSFESRSTSRSPTLLVTFASGSARYVFSFPQHHIPDRSTCSPFYSYQITDLDGKGSRSESIHGLILSHVFKIWNPTLKQFLALPYPDKCSSNQKGWGSYLGYDPLEGKHKVLFMSTIKCTDQPRVLTLGAQESWRIIPKGRCPRHRPCGYGRCFDGILYYRASHHGDSHETIMKFDVKSEYFNVINYPEGLYWSSFSSFHMIPYEGRLALVDYDRLYGTVYLYILEDAQGHKWTGERYVLHLPYESVQKYSIDFRGTTDAGELVFAPFGFHETFYILYLDPRRKGTRKVIFERNMGDLRRRCGLDTNSKFTIEVFPNHIESLFSL
ncbi:putative F-box protein [Raphanus sativus]|nr:putative F-box protein [Raphanus sativus]